MVPHNLTHDLTSEAHQRTLWPKVTLIGSLRFYDEMKGLYEEFGKYGISTLVPWQFLKESENPRQFDGFWTQDKRYSAVAYKFSVEAHLLRVASSDMAYVVNPGGYVGVNSATDIGFALGKRIPVYSMEEISDMGVHVLVDGVKTPEEIIAMGIELDRTKYRILRQEFAEQLKQEHPELAEKIEHHLKQWE